jgi:hypothetical protein
MNDPDVNAFHAERVGDAIIASEVDPGLVTESLNDPDSPISQMFQYDTGLARVEKALATWAEDISDNPNRRKENDIFARDKYITPRQVYEQMGAAYDTLDDDVVSNVADTSESLAFNKIRVMAEDADEENVWNQVSRDLDIDTWIRQAWRELFTVSQFYGVRWWGQRQYQVSGKRKQRRAKRQFDLTVPVQLGFLDPTRVVPVGIDVFGNRRLAWVMSDADEALFRQVADFEKRSAQSDDVVNSLFVGKYTPSEKEIQQFSNENIAFDNLVELNSDFVFAHTLTMAPYERWPRLRMKSIFPLLDLKQQLRAMDRAVLLGGINFIVLVKKGTDEWPVKRNAEIDNLTTQVRTQSKSPVIVSDHRLSIEIITPEIDHILDDEKWTTIDKRLLTRLWGTFMMNPSESQDTSLTLGRVIARGISSRRHMLKRNLEQKRRLSSRRGASNWRWMTRSPRSCRS